MDSRRFNLQHSSHIAVHGLAAGILHDHSHRRTLVQDPQLALRRLLVGGVCKDATVQQRAVRVCDHGSDIPGRIGLAAFFFGVLERFKVGFRLVGPVHRVTFIDGVDGAFLGDAHVRVG